jgi:hypothetical protein
VGIGQRCEDASQRASGLQAHGRAAIHREPISLERESRCAVGERARQQPAQGPRIGVIAVVLAFARARLGPRIDLD